jgi:hypothetical protein
MAPLRLETSAILITLEQYEQADKEKDYLALANLPVLFRMDPARVS